MDMETRGPLQILDIAGHLFRRSGLGQCGRGQQGGLILLR